MIKFSKIVFKNNFFRKKRVFENNFFLKKIVIYKFNMKKLFS